MKFKKDLGALAILLALTTVACNGGGQPSKPTSSAQQSTSALPAIKVTAADDKKTLEVDETVQLTSDVEGVTWESSAAAVATVDDKGLVTAVAAGTAKLLLRKMVIKKAQSPLQLINQQIHYGLHYHVPTPMVNQLKTPLAKNTFH